MQQQQLMPGIPPSGFPLSGDNSSACRPTAYLPQLPAGLSSAFPQLDPQGVVGGVGSRGSELKLTKPVPSNTSNLISQPQNSLTTAVPFATSVATAPSAALGVSTAAATAAEVGCEPLSPLRQQAAASSKLRKNVDGVLPVIRVPGKRGRPPLVKESDLTQEVARQAACIAAAEKERDGTLQRERIVKAQVWNWVGCISLT